MVPCIVIGDSIAAGVGQYRTDCETVAKVGITSDKYIATLLHSVPNEAGTAVISLGVNDSDDEPTLDNLRHVRASFRARQVVWLIPGIKPEVQRLIRQVAAENHDLWIDTASLAGPDHLHPTGQGYQQIASETAGAMAYSSRPLPQNDQRTTASISRTLPVLYPPKGEIRSRFAASECLTSALASPVKENRLSEMGQSTFCHWRNRLP